MKKRWMLLSVALFVVAVYAWRPPFTASAQTREGQAAVSAYRERYRTEKAFAVVDVCRFPTITIKDNDFHDFI